MLKLLSNNTFLILLHIFLGFILPIRPLSKIYGVLVLVFGIYTIYKFENKAELAVKFSAYIVGLEVFLRMAGGSYLYEHGKYTCLIFLLLGLFKETKKKHTPIIFLFYILLLLVGIAFTDVPYSESIRKAVAFNLSGPILLGFSAIYFYKRKIPINTIYQVVLIMLLPILSIVSYLFFYTPDLKDVVFGTQANFALSGGFGPNQVATMLGFGIFAVYVYLLVGKKITFHKFFDFVLLIYVLYRCLFTFSRGGLVTGIVAIMLFSFGALITLNFSFVKKILFTIVSILIFAITFFYVSNLTGGMLEYRFSGKNARGVLKEDATSGRIDIFKTDIKYFYENPFFGIGVGSGKFKRMAFEDGVTAASHNEVSRLIGEHGIIGVIILLMLLIVPLIHIYSQPTFLAKGLLLSFFVFWFLTINHSAMRIAFPAFIYGMSLISIIPDEKNTVHRK